jgi:hypothetical protein
MFLTICCGVAYCSYVSNNDFGLAMTTYGALGPIKKLILMLILIVASKYVNNTLVYVSYKLWCRLLQVFSNNDCDQPMTAYGALDPINKLILILIVTLNYVNNTLYY